MSTRVQEQAQKGMTKINFNSAKFLISAPSLKQCPPDTGAEIAFAGRSNAGKSSAINALTQNKKLTRTSKTPGCTQLINFFQLNSPPNSRLVDLPGYGYAKVPQAKKNEWHEHLAQYLQRSSLKGLILVMDIRHPLQEIDTRMINWALDSEMPLHALLNKSDKLSRGAAQNTLIKIRRELKSAGVDNLVTVQVFSSTTGDGLNELVTQLTNWLQPDNE